MKKDHIFKIENHEIRYNNIRRMSCILSKSMKSQTRFLVYKLSTGSKLALEKIKMKDSDFLGKNKFKNRKRKENLESILE